MRARTLDMYLEMFAFQTLIHLAYVPQVRPVNNNKGTKTIAPHPSDVTSVACPMVNCMSGGGFQQISIKTAILQEYCTILVHFTVVEAFSLGLF